MIEAMSYAEEIDAGIPQHHMFEELSAIDHAFNRENRYSRIDKIMDQGRNTINAYINTIAKYKAQITPEMLLAPENRFSGNVDPVFAFLIRGMCGAQMITDEVFDKVRRAWCGDDIPLSVGEILKTKDDAQFLEQFNAAYFSPTGNVKLTILRRMDVMPRLLKWKF